MARYGMAVWLAKIRPDHPFLPVMLVNIIGSVAIGCLAGWINQKSDPIYLFAAIGILGGFTTFSSYSLDLLTMLRQQLYIQATVFALSQVLLGLAGAAFGFWLTNQPAPVN
ncbi:MAG: CrcB family protein [Fimbriimonadaceae bacterium]|nr:MAG: CrcB family protein [Fimbriimonadaceae bacterium]